jgi:hypothetical protein
MKISCPLKKDLSCDPDRLTFAELLLCRSCFAGRLLFRRHDDHANGPGMGLLLRDAPALELEELAPDLTTMGGRPFAVSPSNLTFHMKEPAFETADIIREGSY